MDFYTIQPNEILKVYARQQLQGFWKKMAFTMFVIALIYAPYFYFSWMDGTADEFSEGDSLTSLIMVVLGIAAWLVNGPFSLGFAGYFLKRVRGEEIATENIFDGFHRFGSAFLLDLLSRIFIFLWALLLIVPGIIKVYSYSMIFYILNDNPGMDTFDAITKSRMMMKGYKLKLFLLELSFVGWFLLGILSFGIAFLWIMPYYYLSIANFYENLKKNQEGQPVDENPAVENQIEENPIVENPVSDDAML